MRPMTFLLCLAGCGSNGVAGPCAAVSGACVSFGKTSTEADIQTAFAKAKANTTFLFGAGTFKFSNELSVSSDNVTIQGAGMDQTILDFTNHVAGVEIELSHFADVYNNEAHDNTAGILVFALPGSGLLVKDCHDVRLHDNMIHDNNTNNFAVAGSTVSILPRGTGTFVLASDKV